MSFNLESFKSKLKDKGIEVNASATEVVAFSWSVEGIEKLPKLGEVLFYKVNGVEYGVKPKKGNKHDIHWYYDQLKTGMKGAKGYSAGLTQFLNVWVKKTKELVIVYKDDKIVESEFDGEVCTASPQLVGETGIDNLLLSEMNINANKWNHGATGICWDVVLKGDKVLVIEYLEDKGVANITYRKGSVKKDIKGIKTVDDLRSKLHKCLSEINAGKVTAASPRKYRPSIRERMDRDSYLDPMDFDITERKDVKAFNKFKKEVQSIELFGRRPFNAFAYINDKPEDLKKAKTGSHKYIEDINIEFRNGFIQIKCSEVEKDRLDEVLSNLNERYKFRVLNYVGNGKFEFSSSFYGNKTLYVLKPDELDYTIKNLRTECKLIEKVVKPFSGVTVTAATEEILKGFEKFKKELEQIEFLGKKPFTAELKNDPLLGEDTIKVFTKDNKLLAEITECPDVHSFIKDAKKFNDNWENNILYFDIGDSICVIFEDGEGGCVYDYVEGLDFDRYLKRLKTNCKEIKDIINKYKGIKITADLKEGEEYEEVDAFIKDVNELTINGKKVFNAEKKGEDIKINLLLKHFETPDMDRLNKLVEDNLEILFPITQKWMDADKGQTFGNTAKVGDIVLYTNEWTSQEFADYIIIERNSKIDYDDLCNELATLYNILAKDCSELETNLFKVTADVCKVTSGSRINKEMISKVKKCFKEFDTPYYNKLLNDLSVIEGTNDREVSINISAEDGADLDKFSEAVDEISSTILDVFPKEEYYIKEEMDASKDAFGMNITKKNRVSEVKETLGEINEENFKGIGTEHDRLLYKKVSSKDFINLWRTSTEFNPSQLSKIIFGFKLASRILGSKFEKSGINIGYFFKKADGKGYIRVEYKDSLYIIYVSQSDENGDIKVVTRKMKKMIPVKNFNLLSTSVSSLAFENATLPPNFKKVWEEVTKG